MSKLCKKTFNSINNKYSSWVEDVTKHASLDISLSVKTMIIEDIAEEYFKEVGEQLPNLMINALTEWFLSGDLKIKNVDKVAKEEYPILSHHQIKRRNKKHPIIEGDTLDFLNQTRGRKTKRITREKDK